MRAQRGPALLSVLELLLVCWLGGVAVGAVAVVSSDARPTGETAAALTLKNAEAAKGEARACCPSKVSNG